MNPFVRDQCAHVLHPKALDAPTNAWLPKDDDDEDIVLPDPEPPVKVRDPPLHALVHSN